MNGQGFNELVYTIDRLLSEKNKVQAVKVYRIHTGVGLKQAKDAVDHFERTGDLKLPTSQPESSGLPLEESALAEIKALIAAGRKIEAVKRYREKANVGLKEAKEAIDQLSS
ncbi:MAG: ribosomal protein L7/L12 [Anaerolineae bacterium]